MKSEAIHEAVLWQAFKLGDKAAFAKIYELNYQALYAYGKKFLPDISLAEDVIQELFITLWRSRHNLADVNNIKFYLFRCLRRDIHKHKEKEERTYQAGFELLSELNELNLGQDLYGMVEEETLLIEKLKALLKSLPERQLEAINLRYYENFSNQEIAVIMDISEKTVRNTLYNALLHLREQSHSLNILFQVLFFAVIQ